MLVDSSGEFRRDRLEAEAAQALRMVHAAAR